MVASISLVSLDTQTRDNDRTCSFYVNVGRLVITVPMLLQKSWMQPEQMIP